MNIKPKVSGANCMVCDSTKVSIKLENKKLIAYCRCCGSNIHLDKWDILPERSK
jgi:transcription elongation factor Elf1